MVVSSAPLLSGLKPTGGTFYTFSSTLRDFSYLFSDSNVRVAPSKFVAVKLPQWADVTNQSMFKDAADIGAPTVTDPNTVFPKVIQNYLENLIQISEADRTDNLLQNYAGPAFWKMLNDLGAINLVDTGNTVIENATTKSLYAEEVNSGTYDRVVKFVGDINLINHVKDGANEYLEIFGLIPTNEGLQEDILFKKGDMVHTASLIPAAGGPNITTGLDDFDGTDNVQAIYDNTITNQYEVGSDLTDADVYFQDLVDNYATKSRKGNFDFNAILVYYDIFDKDDDTTLARNLYGIMTIEDFDGNISGNSEIPTFNKFQPDDNQPGNAYGFRMNLKFSNASNQVTSEITVNDYSTVSMELYMDALRRLHNTTVLLEEAAETSRQVKIQNDRLVQTMFNANQIQESLDDIADHETRLQLIETANQGGTNQRISNEELFAIFQRTIAAVSGQNGNTINIENVIGDRLYLGSVVQEGVGNTVIELNGNQYQWNVANQVWDQI